MNGASPRFHRSPTRGRGTTRAPPPSWRRARPYKDRPAQQRIKRVGDLSDVMQRPMPGVLRSAIVTSTAAVSNRVSTAPNAVSRRSASRSAADRPLSTTADGDRGRFRKRKVKHVSDRRSSQNDPRIGVGNGDRRPLPPNPLCSFPATNEFDHICRDMWCWLKCGLAGTGRGSSAVYAY